MKHRVYVACPSEWAERARLFAMNLIEELGHDAVAIVSRWHHRAIDKYPPDASERASQLAKNLADLERATVLVCLADHGTPRSTFAEVGYALGRGVPVVWVMGLHRDQQCIFDAHPAVWRVKPLQGHDVAASVRRVIESQLGHEVPA